MATTNAVYGTAVPSPASSPTRKGMAGPEEARCAVCQQTNCDIQILGCGCLLHTTCLPLDVLFVKQPMRGTYANQQALCPCCRRSPIAQIRVLPLPMTVLEEAARMRDKDNEVLGDVSALAAGSPANSIALFNGTNKRAFAAKTSMCRSYRTGRWASEESSYTDKLIKSFDAGLLPLPHGIKLNDFLCDLLSCRTSRLTKKLKNAKLSARTYRSWASGNTMGAYSTSYVGGDIQRAQTLFLKTITPEWVRMELQFNISRMWRTHLANFCLQISYLQLNTKEWFTSLDAVDYMAMSCNETKLQARRKRMRSALTEDANAAARTAQPTNQAGTNETEAATEVSCSSSDKEGVFVGGLPFQRLSSLNLKALCDDEQPGVTFNGLPQRERLESRERLDSIGSFLKESFNKEPTNKLTSLRKFSFDPTVIEQSMKHSASMSSFVELFTPDVRPRAASRRASSIDLDDPSLDVTEESKPEGLEVSVASQHQGTEVDSIIDEAIDSVLESSSSEQDHQGLFLRAISNFLVEAEAPFQHVDLWVPMDVSHSDIAGKKHIGGCSSNMATTSSSKVTGIIYGGRQQSSIRLSHAGYITVGAPPQVMNRLNEFGMYSKNFSFSPGFGLPGRAYLSRLPFWEHNLSMLKPEQFARVGGAKIYGVDTCLCVPISTLIGTMVVALYSTENLSRDAEWEKKCMQHFWKLKPEPKWKLTIDVGLKNANDEASEMPPSQAPPSSPRMASRTAQTFVIPPSPTAGRSPQLTQKPPATAMNLLSNVPVGQNKGSTSPPTRSLGLTEQSLALLLGKYMPLDRSSSSNQDVAANLMSIRLLLLRQQSCRTSEESKMVNTIMGKYQNYARANRNENDVVLALVNDWKGLSAMSRSLHEAQSRTSPFGLQRTISGGQSNQMPSPTPNQVFSSSVPQMSQQAMAPINPFDDNFSLPLAAFGGDGLQSMANVASAYSETNNVPRVVSEQGPIQTDANGEG